MQARPCGEGAGRSGALDVFAKAVIDACALIPNISAEAVLLFNTAVKVAEEHCGKALADSAADEKMEAAGCRVRSADKGPAEAQATPAAAPAPATAPAAAPAASLAAEQFSHARVREVYIRLSRKGELLEISWPPGTVFTAEEVQKDSQEAGSQGSAAQVLKELRTKRAGSVEAGRGHLGEDDEDMT